MTDFSPDSVARVLTMKVEMEEIERKYLAMKRVASMIAQTNGNLIKERDEAYAQLQAKEREASEYREALDEISVWSDGPQVNGGFDEPGSAEIARKVLAKYPGRNEPECGAV